MSNQIQTANGNQPTLSMTQVAQSREMQEKMLQFQIAQMNPRNIEVVRANVLEECRDLELAEAAEYSFPRGGTTVNGPSIRLIEALAKYWGNIDFGVVEVERGAGFSVMRAYAIDLQTNTRQTRDFTVKHIRDTKKGSVNLTDERDIYEIGANAGARRLRKCLEGLMPKALIDTAILACRERVLDAQKGSPKSHDQRISDLLKTFEKFGVTKEMIEKLREKPTDEFTPEDFQKMLGVYNAIKDKQQSVGEVFPELAPKEDFPESKGLGLNDPDEG